MTFLGLFEADAIAISVSCGIKVVATPPTAASSNSLRCLARISFN